VKSTILRLALCFLMVSGCEPTTLGGMPSAGPVRPGIAPVSIQNAISMFGSICVKTAPNFHNAAVLMKPPSFVQNSATSTYFHQNLNLSIKLIPGPGGGSCSMEFVSYAKPIELGLALTLISTQGDSKGQAVIGVNPMMGAIVTKARGGTVMTFIPTGRMNGQGHYLATLAVVN
jgi:hypothetical protein